MPGPSRLYAEIGRAISSSDHDDQTIHLRQHDTVLSNVTGVASGSDALTGASTSLIMTPNTTAVSIQLAAFLQSFNG